MYYKVLWKKGLRNGRIHTKRCQEEQGTLHNQLRIAKLQVPSASASNENQAPCKLIECLQVHQNGVDSWIIRSSRRHSLKNQVLFNGRTFLGYTILMPF